MRRRRGESLGVQTTTGVVMGGAALGSRNKDAFRTGEEAANVIKSAYKLRACVDRHVQDMLVVLMALADGRSTIRTEPLTMHTQTAIHVAQLMTQAKFTVSEQENGSFIIECDGIGMQNHHE